MDVSVSVLRAELSTWLERVRDGEEVIVTDRGTPVARFVPVGSTQLIAQLTEQGVISKAKTSNRPNARTSRRVQAAAPVADLVAEQRR